MCRDTAACTASTRPQRLAVEIRSRTQMRRPVAMASTRPQRLAVEIRAYSIRPSRFIRGFNEATAISCGDHPCHRSEAPGSPASTRPQRLAVEIVVAQVLKRSRGCASTRPQRLAVEIPAKLERERQRDLASTRPQRLAVEIGVPGVGVVGVVGGASTRPQRLAVEIIDGTQAARLVECLLQRGHSD